LSKTILIVGLGSIGSRHLKNLLHLGVNDISLIRRTKEVSAEFSNISVYTSIKEACEKKNFTHAFITTPTKNHYKDFLALSESNIQNIYIEKPITDLVEEALDIEFKAKELDLNVVVGYDLHFDLGLQKVIDLLASDTIGEVCTFFAEVGQYLPDWRPSQDYSKSMSAKKNLGGGVMLDLIHEFDYINWILGPVSKILGKHKKSSNLKIETEDISVNILETKNGIIGTLTLDYLQKELSRTLKIIGNFGTIIWDYKESSVKWMTHESKEWNSFDYSGFSRNDRFVEITKAFLDSSTLTKDKRLSSISDAIQSLKMVEKAKETNDKENLEFI
jgi:predicted dehydrogenase